MPERYGRQYAIIIACGAGNEDCIRDAIKIGSKDVKGEQRIPPGLEADILCNYFKHTEDRDEFITVFNRMNKLYQPSESRYKTRLINALTCTKNSEYLYEFLETSLGMHTNNVNYTRSERRAIFNGVVGNPNGMDVIFKLIENYPGNELPSSYGWTWLSMFRNIASSVFTDQDKNRFLEYMSNVNYTGMSINDIAAAKEAADENLSSQKLPSNAKQFELVQDLLDREFLEITTVTEEITSTTESTISTTDSTISVTESTVTTTEPTTSKPDDTTTVPITIKTEAPTTIGSSSTTDPPTTTPDSASSIKISILAFILIITLGIVMQN